jgi:ribonuclease-3
MSEARMEYPEKIEASFGYCFKDRKLLELALTHRSWAHEAFASGSAGPGEPIHYERLEFLGDAVLELAVSDLLMKRYPTAAEGELSRLRSGLVNTDRLAALALAAGLDGALRLGRGEESSGGRSKNSILADVFEAVIAAIYLDGGFEQALAIASRQFSPLLESPLAADLLDDYKTPLQEKIQARLKTIPCYRVVCEEGPDHRKIFEVELIVNGKAWARGRGRSKKEAEQDAARKAIQASLFEDEPSA